MKSKSKNSKWDSDESEDDNQSIPKSDNQPNVEEISNEQLNAPANDVNEESNTEPLHKKFKSETDLTVKYEEASISSVSPKRVIEIVEEVEEKCTNVEKSSERAHNPIFDGCRSVECYQRLNFIDQGTYGMVFRARCKNTNEIYALKQVKLGAEANKVGFPVTALREINILLALQHPNIVRVREMVVGSSIDKVYMVMEYCENDLKTCMKLSKQPFSTAEVKQLMMQLLSAMEHMHSKWYIHRDLKTSNLLYNNKGFLSVCDFGLARKYGSPIAAYTAPVVTLWYRAPELLLGSRLYSIPIDMWSVGCIFAEMLQSGEPLLPGEGEADQISKIFKLLGAPNEQRWPGFSSLPNVSKISLKMPTKSKLRDLIPMTSFSGGACLSDCGMDLLSQLLNMDPAKRISAKLALQHGWLKKELPCPTPLDMMPTFKSRHE